MFSLHSWIRKMCSPEFCKARGKKLHQCTIAIFWEQMEVVKIIDKDLFYSLAKVMLPWKLYILIRFNSWRLFSLFWNSSSWLRCMYSRLVEKFRQKGILPKEEYGITKAKGFTRHFIVFPHLLPACMLRKTSHSKHEFTARYVQ